ncbi:hypothetical protein [Chlamydia vaughanii]|uniref:hypothetical protein n=1 Tax=Chlamydia vaughanii TaxID=3112552 RepID=UPI0032B10B77
MCCPCCKSTTPPTPPTGANENIPLTGGGGGNPPPITGQPRANVNVNVNIGLGGDGIMDAILNTGELVSGILNSPRTQRTARHVRDGCGPWCDSHCPSWLSSCFTCCCVCLINEDENGAAGGSGGVVTRQPRSAGSPAAGPSAPPQDSDEDEGPECNVKDVVKGLRNKYGPIVLGSAIKHSGLDLQGMINSNTDMDQQQQGRLEDHCKLELNKLQKQFLAPLQKDLFEVTNNPQKLPEPKAKEVKAVRRGYDSKPYRCYQPPVVRLKIPVIVPGDDGKPQKIFKKVNFNTLEEKLSQMPVMNMQTGQEGPLGPLSRDVSLVLQNAMHFLVENSAAFDPSPVPSGQYELTMNLQTFLQILLLSLLSAERSPVGPRGEHPQTMQQLTTLMQKVRKHSNLQEGLSEEDRLLEADGTTGGDQRDSQGATGGDDSGATGGAAGGGGSDWFSPRNQEKMLQKAQKANQAGQKHIFW